MQAGTTCISGGIVVPRYLILHLDEITGCNILLTLTSSAVFAIVF